MEVLHKWSSYSSVASGIAQWLNRYGIAIVERRARNRENLARIVVIVCKRSSVSLALTAPN